MKKRSSTLAALFVGALMVSALPGAVLAQDDESSSAIEGPVWVLEAAPDAIPSGTGANLHMLDGAATIDGGCNAYFGAYTLDGESLTFGELAGTKAACEGDAQAVEDVYIPALGNVASYAIFDDGSLGLMDSSGAHILTFSEASAAAAADLGAVEASVAANQAHIRALREHVHSLRIGHLTDQVAALQGHVNTLTKQHTATKNKLAALQQSVRAEAKAARAFEVQMIDVIAQLVKAGLVEAQ